MSAAPAAADEPGDNPTDPWLRSLRLSLGEQARQDRCQAGQAVHFGGPSLDSVAASLLTGPDARLRAFVDPAEFGSEWYKARARDSDVATADMHAFWDRQDKLNAANEPYASVNSSGGRDYWAPEFGKDIVYFTLGAQQDLYNKARENPAPRPGQTALDAAKKVFDGFDTGDDTWAAVYKDVAGRALLDPENLGNSSANDIATFLRFGGFPTRAPEPDSLEFRNEVEALKTAWAGCDSANPIDHYRALTGPVVQAYSEWEAEYAGQAEQRKAIVTAKAAAAKETRVATDAMIEAVRQAWQADQILYWQKYWAANKGSASYPKPAVFTKATADLNAAKAAAAKQVPLADAAATRAKTAAATAGAQQTKAWEIADAARLPRGRGLLYAQQSVQVAKASAAATLAAAKATLTASNAAKATVADSQTLLALAKTQTHALNTEFRKSAALEAKAQAKAAAESAAKLATEAAANAATAKTARATAEKAEQTAKTQAAEAKRQRGIAETERATAERERDLAASERAKAGDTEERAKSEQAKAGQARTAAETAGATATEKLAAAVDAELRARLARDKAVEAESDKNATESRAAALESAAAADEGTSAAEETQQAATEARSAATDAAGAATRARTAANEATTAAVNARAAATRAEGAAKRSRSAADAAQSAYAKTHAAATTAHASAAEAIDAAAAAKENAKQADVEAKKAQAASITARKEATAAVAEAVKTAAWSAKTAGYALATAQYAQGARDAATATTKAADEAISVGSPYRETDASAAYAVLIGQTSKTLAQQQASAAKAKSDEAKKAAATAKALADKAAGDAKIALQAAADAADYAVQAVNSAAAANASAVAAATDSAAAKKADANAQKYDAQAGTDAFYANSAANDAESAAAQADRDASEAEKDAAGARSAASAAESDASAADRVATDAESDAVKAEKAASNAQNSAKEAQDAATRAEDDKARDELTKGGATGIGGLFTRQKITPLGDPEAMNDCELNGTAWDSCEVKFKLRYDVKVDFYLCQGSDDPNVSAATCPIENVTWLGSETYANQTGSMTRTFTAWDVTKMVDRVFLALLWDMFVQDFVDCANGSGSGCAWAASNFVPGKKIGDAVDAIRGLDAALKTGVGVGDAIKALKKLELDPQVLKSIERQTDIIEEAFTACRANSFPAGTGVLMTDGTRKAISEVREGDLLLAADPDTGELRPQPVTDTFRHDTNRLVDITVAGDGLLSSTVGHRFFVTGRGWTLVSDLRVGDRLRTPDGSVRAVTALQDRSGLVPQEVYDLTVGGLHTFFVRTGGARPQDVLVHNCTNILADEGIEGAHTLEEHVDLSPQKLANKLDKDGVATQWASRDIAVAAVDQAMVDWIKLPGNVKKLEAWRIRQAQRVGKNIGFDSKRDLLSIRMPFTGHGPSLGTKWVSGGSSAGQAVGNTVVIQLKFAKGHMKPKTWVVFTAYPE
ncbi:polymorphic toxin-type HINT domain-containing protein [Streptomyces sp. B21-083]|uniref:polymorphic toxin-type HINT domain-containing protein n=1 Tax=Streptomyces sp. B21-083 TaxID=3039410 RepID=UPI002FF1BDA3